MGSPARVASIAALSVAATAAPAAAADFCVGVERDGCEPRESIAAAVQDAGAEGRDRIFLGAGDHRLASAAADAVGGPLEILGAGEALSRLLPAAGAAHTLVLGDAGSWLSDVTVDPPEGPGALGALQLAGVAYRITLRGPGGPTGLAADVTGGRAVDVEVTGGLRASGSSRIERGTVVAEDRPALLVTAPAAVVAESLDVAASGDAAAVSVGCSGSASSTLAARHLTVTGEARTGGDAACTQAGQTARLDFAYGIVAGDFTAGAFDRFGGGASVHTRTSNYAPDEDVSASTGDTDLDPRFVAADDHRLGSGSPLIDRAGPLEADEGFTDAAGLMRVADGDGDGAYERDIGAHEHHLAPPPASSGNVLSNPGAEAGAAGEAPPGWTRAGNFGAVRYGTVERAPGGPLFEMPGRAVGEALGGGTAFFAAGPGDGSTLLQRVDVTGAAREIDAGGGTATVSGLLGGYGFDEDRVTLTATFRDPAGVELGRLVAGPVTPAERGNVTGLLRRAASGSVPARTRAVDVEVVAERVGANTETYNDAYADNLELVMSVPGVPVEGPVDRDDPPVDGLRPFAGVTILSARPVLSRRGRTRVWVACASATVGRCSGTLDLRAALRRRSPAVRVAPVRPFSLRPGRREWITLRLTRVARRALRRRRSFRATLLVVARDGQALQRRRTVPLVVRRARR